MKKTNKVNTHIFKRDVRVQNMIYTKMSRMLFTMTIIVQRLKKIVVNLHIQKTKEKYLETTITPDEKNILFNLTLIVIQIFLSNVDNHIGLCNHFNL